jgi:8-oxo-dGTP diphosphatase
LHAITPDGWRSSALRVHESVTGALAPDGRKVTDVAVGVLWRADGAVLLADRPAGKPYAGYWEFPGGKIESGESVEHALARELNEELGIDIGPALPWVTFEFDYPHAYVRLHFCRVFDWRGEPQGREGQQLRFFRLDQPLPQPLLPAAQPALRWLSLPVRAALVDPDCDPATLLPALDAALAAGLRLLIVHDAGLALPASTRAAAIAQLALRAAACGALLIGSSVTPAPRHTHLAEAALAHWKRGADVGWTGVDATTRATLSEAAARGCDFALVSPVLAAVGDAGVPLGWHGVRALIRQTPLPVLVGGGLTSDDLATAQAAGAHGIALPLAHWTHMHDQGAS